MQKMLPSQGIAFILSSPSGGGKSSIAAKLIENDSNLILSVSATSRKKRSSEIDGVHYFFKTQDDFVKLMQGNEFLEYAEIYDYMYGTIRANVEQALSNGRDMIFDINWEGAKSLKENLHNTQVVSIFIMPTDIKTLYTRLELRGQDDQATIDKRMNEAKQEMSYAKYYDYIVINDEFEEAVKQIDLIIQKTRSGVFANGSKY